MLPDADLKKFLPLTEATYYIMLALIEPAHGYAVMQQVEQVSRGTVALGPGTLYGVLSTLEKEGLIIKTGEEERRKYYQLTRLGRGVLAAQIERLELMAHNGLAAAGRLAE